MAAGGRQQEVRVKRLWAGAALAVTAGALATWYVTSWERTAVTLERFTVTVDRPGLPPGGLIVLHLSDLHYRRGGAVQERKSARLLKLLDGERFDVLAVTGDLIHNWAGLPAALDLVERLRPRLGAYFCPGNHDYTEYSVWGVFGHTWARVASRVSSGDGRAALPARTADVLRQLAGFARKVLRNELVRLPVAFNDVAALLSELQAHGVEPLVNCAVHLEDGGGSLWLAGIDDLLEGNADLAAAIRAVPESAPLVLLAHNPDVWLDPRVARCDLVLSGHTHGGQIMLPLVGAAHTQGTHLSRRKAAGWFQRGRTRMFVSRGLGESIPLRFRARPQAALIRLMPR